MADELKNPVRRSVIGEIISIKEINKDDFKEGKFRHDCRIVRVDPLNGAPLVDVYITNDQYDKYGLNAIVFAGNVVNFSIDENIAGETGYIDPDTEEWTYHEKTFNSFAGADNVGSLGLISVFGKLGVGADIVASWTLIAEEAPSEDRAKHCGSAQFAWALGPAVVLLISAWINQFGLIGNRIVFAHLIIVAAWVWYQRLKMPESKDWKQAKEAEQKLIAEGKIKPVSYSEILSGINLKTVLFLCGVYTIWNLCASTWGFFMPYIFENVGKLSNSMSQLMSVGSFVISFVGTYFIFMRLGDKMSRRLLYAIIGGIYVIAWGVWVLPPEMLAMWMLVMFTVFAGINNGSGQQAFYQLWSSELFPTKYRATAQGLTFFITRILAAVWGFSVPIIMTTFGFRYAAMLMVAFAFISWLVGVIGAPKTEGKTLKQIEIERYGHEVK